VAKAGQVPKTKNGIIVPEGVIFYYIRDKNNQPIACVAIADNGEGQYSRGISICSPRDQFDRSSARKKAFGRLCKAFGTGTTQDQILPNADIYRGRDRRVDQRLIEVMHRVGTKYKTGADIDLTEYERMLVAKTTPVEEESCSTS
jgi:hypothetical protein